MPIHRRESETENKVFVMVYYAGFMPGPHPGADALLRAMKKEATILLEEMQAAKKMCEKVKDFDGARMFRDQVADAQRQYRAITFIAPWFMSAPLPGDCSKVLRPRHWPTDLALELDLVLARLTLLE